MTAIRNLDSILPANLRGNPFKYPVDVLNQTVIIHTAKGERTEKGIKVTFEASLPDKVEHFFIVTRASQPVLVAEALKKENAFPVTGKFVTEGQTVLFVDPEYVPSAQPTSNEVF